MCVYSFEIWGIIFNTSFVFVLLDWIWYHGSIYLSVVPLTTYGPIGTTKCRIFDNAVVNCLVCRQIRLFSDIWSLDELIG